MMKVLVVDDEPLARERLQRILSDIEGYEWVGEAGNGKEAIQKTETLEPDIVLMDIRMPVMDGLDAAHEIGELQIRPAIIFTTAFSDHALEAFDTPAEDYLLKPIRKEKLEKALNSAVTPNKAQLRQAEQKDNEERTHVCTTIGNTVKLIPVDSILYFHAEHKYVTLRYTEGSALIEEPLKKLEQEFSSSFLRIHRNALVAIKHVAGMARSKTNGNVITFNGADDVLEVSRRHLPLVRKALRIKGEHQTD